MMRHKLLVASSLIAAAALAAAAVRQGIEIKYKPVGGEVYEYDVKGTFYVTGQLIELKGTAVVKTVKVDGTQYFDESTDNFTLSVDGSEETPQPAVTTRRTHAFGGKVVVTEGVGTSTRAEALQQFIEPGKPVKIGEIWIHEAATDAKRDLPAYRIQYKYVGDEKIGQWDCARFLVNAWETEGEKPQIFETSLWLSKTD